MPPLRQKGGSSDLMDADISFPLARLFDPYNMDQIPEKQQMDRFEHRDLAHVKHYKAAVKIFGGPLSRKRVIVAPPMETPTKHRLGLYMDRKSPPPSKTLNSELNPQIPMEKPLPEELIIAKQAQEREDKYKAWFKERQKFRNDLENMGLNMDWLTKKPNKSVLEKRVLCQLKEAKGQKIEIEDEVVRETPKSSSGKDSRASSGLPTVSVPTPLGLKVLEHHLRENKLRLIDLFTAVDKNKDWKISREEFLKMCDEQKIPVSLGLLEDMMISLDMNLDEELDYREIARGMDAWKRQRRDDRRRELSREASTMSGKSVASSQAKQPMDGQQDSTHSTPSRHSTKPRVKKASVPTLDTGTTFDGTDIQDRSREPTKSSIEVTSRTAATRSGGTDHKIQINIVSLSKPSTLYTDKTGTKLIKPEREGSAKMDKISIKVEEDRTNEEIGQGSSGNTSDRSLSPQYLEPPDPDVRLEQLVLDNEEAMVDIRKRDRAALKGYTAKLKIAPSTIKTGSKAVDDHCMKSTMSGEIGEMVNSFRHRRLQEYYEIMEICELNDVPLSRSLLEKVLLYPPDKPHNDIKKKIRPPDLAPLLSSHFAHPQKRPRTPIEVKHKDKVRRSRSGKLMIDTRHQYPTGRSIEPYGYKMNLSTGRAVVRRRVDCWMSFEEYERLTKHLAVRYQHIYGTRTENAFWPGHLLDKVRLAMPPYDQPQSRDKENAIFTRVHRTKAVNYGYEPTDAWPVNDDGHVQIGIHDHFRDKYI